MSRQVGEGKQKVLFSQPFPSTSAPSLSSLRPAVPSEKCGPRSPVRMKGLFHLRDLTRGDI